MFTGSCAALVTPYTETSVNYPKLGELIERQIDAGTDAICICGTTGESVTQTEVEHQKTVEFCVKQVNGRVKVLAGAGSNVTTEAIRLSRQAEDSGADALLIVTPYYNKATQLGLIRHYEAIAEQVHTPIVLYNVPSRTGVSFTAETYQVLSRHPNIAGVKEASGNLSLAIHTQLACGPDFTIWSGNDDQVVPMMSMGAAGVISVAANLVPEVMRDMTHLCLDGRFEQAAELQLEYTGLLDALTVEVNPIPVKTALNLMGLEVGPLRLPLCEMTPDHLKTLKSTLEHAGLCSLS